MIGLGRAECRSIWAPEAFLFLASWCTIQNLQNQNTQPLDFGAILESLSLVHLNLSSSVFSTEVGRPSALVRLKGGDPGGGVGSGGSWSVVPTWWVLEQWRRTTKPRLPFCLRHCWSPANCPSNSGTEPNGNYSEDPSFSRHERGD